MGSYGAHWSHGWVPLNAQATALKLKQLRAGDKGAHSAEHHGGYRVHVAHTGNGRYGALVVGPSGASHYSAHATRATAIADAGEHVATMRGRDSAKALTAGKGTARFRAQKSTHLPGASANTHHVYDYQAGGVARDEAGRLAYFPTRAGARGFADRMNNQDNAKQRDTAKALTGRVRRAQRDSTGVLVRPTGPTSVNSAGLPHGYAITSDRFGHSLSRNGIVIRTSSERENLVGYAHDHAKGDVSAHPKSVNDELKAKASEGAKVSGLSEERSSSHVTIKDSRTGQDYTMPTYMHEAMLAQGHTPVGVRPGSSYGGVATGHLQTRHTSGSLHEFDRAGAEQPLVKVPQISYNAPRKRAAKPGFSKQEMMLPGVRVHSGNQIIVRPSAKMSQAGHRFSLAGGPSPLVEHDQFGVEHSNGAHLGHIDTNGGLHITGPGLERHRVGNVKEAVAGLHANYTIRQREAEAKKTAEAAKAESAKAANDASRAQREELAALAHRVAKSRGNTGYTIEQNILRNAQGSHEQRRDALKAMVAKYSASDLKPLINTSPAKPPRPVKSDTPTMIGNREKLQRATERSQPLELSGSQFGDDAHASIREGLPITHGGVAGHVIGVYGQTFDTYHPKDAQGRGGYYMRHEVSTRRGKKSLSSRLAGQSKAS